MTVLNVAFRCTRPTRWRCSGKAFFFCSHFLPVFYLTQLLFSFHFQHFEYHKFNSIHLHCFSAPFDPPVTVLAFLLFHHLIISSQHISTFFPFCFSVNLFTTSYPSFFLYLSSAPHCIQPLILCILCLTSFCFPPVPSLLFLHCCSSSEIRLFYRSARHTRNFLFTSSSSSSHSPRILRLDNTLEEIIFKLVPGLRESEFARWFHQSVSSVCSPCLIM